MSCRGCCGGPWAYEPADVIIQQVPVEVPYVVPVVEPVGVAVPQLVPVPVSVNQLSLIEPVGGFDFASATGGGVITQQQALQQQQQQQQPVIISNTCGAAPGGLGQSSAASLNALVAAGAGRNQGELIVTDSRDIYNYNTLQPPLDLVTPAGGTGGPLAVNQGVSPGLANTLTGSNILGAAGQPFYGTSVNTNTALQRPTGLAGSALAAGSAGGFTGFGTGLGALGANVGLGGGLNGPGLGSRQSLAQRAPFANSSPGVGGSLGAAGGLATGLGQQGARVGAATTSLASRASSCPGCR